MLESSEELDNIIKEEGIENITDVSIVNEIISKVLKENSESVNDYLSGTERAFKYLMGQVMKESHGKVDPKLANQTLLEELNKIK